MDAGATQVRIGGEELTLLPSGAVYWASRAALFVADLHLRKAAAFRSHAVPVPAGSSDSTLNRLSQDVEQSGANQMFMLGDLWHAKAGRTALIEEAFGDW